MFDALMFAAIALIGHAGTSASVGPELRLGAVSDRTVRIPRAPRPPRIEDFVNGPDFPAYARIADFRQREPADGAPVSRETTAYVAYDNASLYVIFDCRAPRDGVRAHLSRRDDIDNDDGVLVILDTFRDRRRAYQFRVNPLGVQSDAMIADGEMPDLTFDTVWASEGRLTRNGYIVRLAIPFRSLRFSSSGAQAWGIGLARAIPANSETAYWPRVTVRRQGIVSQLGQADGFDRVSAGRNVQLIPYATASRSRYLDAPDDGPAAFVRGSEASGGLDAKVVLRDALTVDATVNPDFSQVESDEPQATVNQRFEVFFPEKRPFFLENANYFRTPETLFFSRRVADPSLGARVSGRSGGWLMGALAIDDRAPGLEAAPNEAGYGRRGLIGVARVQRTVAGQSWVGFLATSRDFAGGFNRVLAFDTTVRLNANWVASGQATATTTRATDGTPAVAGSGYFGRIQHDGAHVNYFASYTDRSPDFQADLGYIPQVDIRQGQQMLGVNARRPARGVNLIQGWVWTNGNWNRKGEMQDAAAQTGFYAVLVRRTYVNVWWTERSELVDAARVHTDGPGVFVQSDWFDRLGFSAQYRAGARPNYSPAAGLAPFTASSTYADAGITLRPAPRLRIDERYLYQALTTRGASPAAPAGTAVFTNHIARTKVNVQFTRALSARLILDYNGVAPNVSLVDLERSRRFTADVLAAWLLHPGTAVYVGFSDARENLAIAWPDGRPAAVRTSPLTAVGRQFFLKVSYLFRP